MKRWVTVYQTNRKRGSDMPKINQEEYKVLKGLDDKWEWIARDRSGELYIHEEKPKKFATDWVSERDYYLYLGNETFQFIQWEDEEPYDIAELIGEYEESQMTYLDNKLVGELVVYAKESEEKEVKNIEWLKEEVWKQDVVMDKGYIYTDDLMSIINELDEPEVTLDRAFEKVAESYSMTKEEVWRHLERFEAHGDKVTYEETEVKKDIEWLKNKLKEIREKNDKGNNFEGAASMNLALRLIDQLDEPEVLSQEMPVIPKFVANWIEETKKQYKTLIFAFTHIYDKNEIDESPNKEENRIFQWMESANNEEVFARAWLDGFTVETEQKYYVINNDQRMMLVRMMDGKTITEADPFKLEDMYEAEKKAHRLTEKEIKDYDERYIPFMVPVDEVNND